MAVSGQHLLSSALLLFGFISVSLCLCLWFFLRFFLRFYLFLSLSFGLSFFPFPSCFCMCLCLFMSLGFSRILSLPLSHSAILSNSVSCYVSLSFSDSLWLSLCLCLSDHLPVLGLILSPSLPLPFILSVPPCSFVVVPGYLEILNGCHPGPEKLKNNIATLNNYGSGP